MIKDRIKEQLEYHKISYARFAVLVGVTERTVNRWVSGEAHPNKKYIVKMRDIFNCSLEYLLEEL